MRIAIVCLASSLLVTVMARAASAGIFSSVDALTSTVLQEGQSSFSGVAIRAGIHPARLIKQVQLVPAIEYWRNSSTLKPFDIESTRKDATFAFAVRYAFTQEGWEPYLGAGFGVHFLSTRVKAPSLGLPDASDSVIKGGAAALAGVTLGLAGRLDNFFELEYHHVPDFRQLKINWGLSYRL